MLWGLSRFVLPVENDHNFILVYGKSWILCSKLKVPSTVQRDGSKILNYLFGGKPCLSHLILKVQPKLGSFDRSSLKSEAQRILEKSTRPPCCESLSKLRRHLLRLLKKNCQRRTQICQRPFIYYVHVELLATSLWTNLESVRNGAVNSSTARWCL